jgi:tRNA (pseudouridine54-N1)-methyltransferase
MGGRRATRKRPRCLHQHYAGRLMRRFVIVGQRATASGEFRLNDLAGSSGRLDVLLRCIRAAILVSHGVRRGVVVYLVLRGGPQAPRVLRVDAAATKFLRPDERSLATLVQKALGADACGDEDGFVDVRPGLSVRRGGIDEIVPELADGPLFVLEPNGEDVRLTPGIGAPNTAFVIGDHLGLDEKTRSNLLARGAIPIRIGPLAIHADDVVAILSNELDRRSASPS